MNLDFTIAVTQNFCSPTNLPVVWAKTVRGRPKLAQHWLKSLQVHRPELVPVIEQVSSTMANEVAGWVLGRGGGSADEGEEETSDSSSSSSSSDSSSEGECEVVSTHGTVSGNSGSNGEEMGKNGNGVHMGEEGPARKRKLLQGTENGQLQHSNGCVE